jgi:flagellar motor protein MotB
MRVAVTSLLRLTLSSVVILSPMSWAVPTQAPAAQTTTATPSPQANPPVVAPPKPNIISAVAGANTTVQTQAQAQENKPLTAEQIVKEKASQDAKVKALVKDQATRLQQLEKANLEALAQNQELQLKNDNLGVQVQVLQSEQSAQMFLYGAATIAVGVLLGFLIASYIYTKRRRQW